MKRARRRPLQIAVAGGNRCSQRTARLARALGREITAAGAVLLCGGLGGVMEAVAQGAAEAGGTVIGILPGYRHDAGNRHLTVRIPTGRLPLSRSSTSRARSIRSCCDTLRSSIGASLI